MIDARAYTQINNEGIIYADGGADSAADGVHWRGATGPLIIYAAYIRNGNGDGGGTISGRRNGITSDGNLVVYNGLQGTDNGTIMGRNGAGIAAAANASIVNWGAIIGQWDGVSQSGDGDGIRIAGNGRVENYGIIRGSSAHGSEQARADGIVLNTGSVVTYGEISGAASAILFVPTTAGGANEVDNFGTIRGGSDTAIKMTGDQRNLIVNGGTIIAGANGIAVDMGDGNDDFDLTGVVSGVVDGGAGNDSILLGGGPTGPIRGDSLSNVRNFENLTVNGSWTLADAQSYSDGVIINSNSQMTLAGALQSPTIKNFGTLVFDLDDNYVFNGLISGRGSVQQLGAGAVALTANNSYAGPTEVGAGALFVNGDQSGAIGTTRASAGATVGGTGTIGGDVVLADRAILAPGAAGVGTLTIKGNLSISPRAVLAYEFGKVGIAGGALNDLVEVGGNLVLDGTINVSASAGGSFGPGIYRVFNYGGTLINNGLSVGMLPAGNQAIVQTAISGQVNLVNAGGLSFWDGDAGPKFNGAVDGGHGVWQSGAGNNNWTGSDGAINSGYADGTFAVFGRTGGRVMVDGSLGDVTAAGMQFATSGYTVAGDGIMLTDPQSTIRVGDGSTGGTAFTATINAALSGNARLVKSDAGTLLLGGINSYTGGTLVGGGTVQIATDANLGAARGNVTIDGGTLATSATMTSTRAFAMAGAGTISTADATSFTLSGRLSGAGALTKAGAGTLLVAGDSSGFTGTTTIAAGTLAVTGSLGGAMRVGVGGRLEGTGSVGGVDNFGTMAPGGGGFGTLTLANYTGAGGRLEIETSLGGDMSETDRIVADATAGSTAIDLSNRGGLGGRTGEGIKIIDVTGASNGTFTLNGDYMFEGNQAVIVGSYGYRLYRGGVATPTDGDWYLRSTLLDPTRPNGLQMPLYQPGVPVYESYGQTLLTLTDLGTLRQRVGSRQWPQTESSRSSGIWGSMQSSRSRANAAVSTSLTDVNTDSWKFEVGTDQVLSERSDRRSLVLGLLGGYGGTSANIRSIYGNGSIKSTGYSAGATLTWFGGQGLYIDGRAQLTRFDSKLRSAVLGTLADGNDATGQAYSLEVGKEARLGRALSVIPQIQTVYQTVNFDAFTDPNGATVSSGLGDSLKTRGGLSIDRQDAQSHLYAVANVIYEWLGRAVADVSGTPIARSNDRLWGGLGIGGTVVLGNRATLYAEALANTALRDFGTSYSIKNVVGLRLNF